MLYFSLHRYDNAMFYPKSTAAGPAHVGGVSAKGYNVNMAWNGSMMGDPEYLAAFHHLLLPIASEVVQRENEKTRKTRESLMYIIM